MQVHKRRAPHKHLAGKGESTIKVTCVWSLQRKACAAANTSQAIQSKSRSENIIFCLILLKYAKIVINILKWKTFEIMDFF